MLEDPIPPPFDRSAVPDHPWDKPAIFVANMVLGFFIIVVIIFTVLGHLPDPKPKAVVAKKVARSKDGKYTKEEVAKHNTAEDIWLILDGKVYDLTEYLEEHPGGAAMLKHAGADSSKGFHGPQHPSRVFEMVDEYLIGTLVETDKDK